MIDCYQNGKQGQDDKLIFKSIYWKNIIIDLLVTVVIDSMVMVEGRPLAVYFIIQSVIYQRLILKIFLFILYLNITKLRCACVHNCPPNQFGLL